MRHFFLSLAAASAALLCGIGTAHAVPAKPGLIQVTQSDGTQLTVRLVGDERRHYMLSSDGYTLTGGPDGDLYYAELSASGKLIPTKVKARPVNALTADEKAVVSRLGKELKPTYVKPMVMPAPQQTQAPVLPAAGKPAPPRRITSAQTTGRLKSLIILVESSDKKFASASAQQDFRNLLMQDGYSVNGATGSAWNYYQDNSNRLFDPEFVVVGPYKASKTSAYYAGSEGSDNVPELIVEACRLADNDVNFTDFADNGVIRDVFVFYAGRGQADSGDTQSIWPHRWDVRVNSKYLDVRFDGVQLQGYACGAELNGGYQMTAIGTFCHEFGHVLGWPDFYDTDYSASGGTAPALESFSLMCSGSYNNNDTGLDGVDSIQMGYHVLNDTEDNDTAYYDYDSYSMDDTRVAAPVFFKWVDAVEVKKISDSERIFLAKIPRKALKGKDGVNIEYGFNKNGDVIYSSQYNVILDKKKGLNEVELSYYAGADGVDEPEYNIYGK